MALEPFAIVFDELATGSKAIPKPGAGFAHRRRATIIEFVSHSIKPSCALICLMQDKSMRLPTRSRFVVSSGSLASADRLLGTAVNRDAPRILIPILAITSITGSTSLPFFNSTHARFTHGGNDQGF